MSHKKKNKALPLIILICVAAVLGGVYAILYRLDLNADKEDDTTVITIQSKNSNELCGVTFTDKNGDIVTLKLENNIWYVDGEPEFPLDYSKATEIASSAMTLLATRELDSEQPEYGFDDPQNVLTFYFEKDGTQSTTKYTVGTSNSFNGGTYLRDDVSGKIYICSSNPASEFNVAKNDLIELDTHAYDVDPTSVKSVTLTSGDGRETTISDDDGVEEFIQNPFDLIDCKDWIKYAVDDEGMKEYGITKDDACAAIRVDYKTSVSATDADGESTTLRQDAVYNVWFGDALEDGSVYYTITGSTIVYKTSKENYDAIMAYLDYVPAPATTDTDAAVTE